MQSWVCWRSGPANFTFLCRASPNPIWVMFILQCYMMDALMDAQFCRLAQICCCAMQSVANLAHGLWWGTILLAGSHTH